MQESADYYSDVHEPEIEPGATLAEVKARVSELAEEARATSEQSYKAYLVTFAKLIGDYVTAANDQAVRGAIFMYACEHDYHLPNEIEALPDHMPRTLTQGQQSPDSADDDDEDDAASPTFG